VCWCARRVTGCWTSPEGRSYGAIPCNASSELHLRHEPFSVLQCASTRNIHLPKHGPTYPATCSITDVFGGLCRLFVGYTFIRDRSNAHIIWKTPALLLKDKNLKQKVTCLAIHTWICTSFLHATLWNLEQSTIGNCALLLCLLLSVEVSYVMRAKYKHNKFRLTEFWNRPNYNLSMHE